MVKGTLTYEGVANLMVKGKSTKQIAFAYGVSEKTVSNFKHRNGITKDAVKIAMRRAHVEKILNDRMDTKKKDRSEVAKQAWVTRRANQLNKVASVSAPKVIDWNGLQIEIHGSMVNKVIVPTKNLIKIIC